MLNGGGEGRVPFLICEKHSYSGFTKPEKDDFIITEKAHGKKEREKMLWT